MNDQEFKEKLSAVAEWRIPPVSNDTLKRRPGRPSKEQQFQEENENEFLATHNGINPTMAPEILAVKCQPTTCEDCGKHCANGRQKEKKLYEANKKRHWRERCVTCALWLNPYTGQYDLPNSRASVIWNNYVRDSKGIYKSKGNLAKALVSNDDSFVDYEDQKEIIRKYPESRPKG